MLAAQILSLSLNEALLVLTASRRGDAARLFATALWLTLGLSALAAGIAALWIVPWALAARPDLVQATGRLCLWLIPTALLSTVFLDALRGRHDEAGWVMLRVVQSVAYSFGAVAAWSLGAGLYGFALAFVASHALAMIAAGGRLAGRGWFAAGVADTGAAGDLAGLGARLQLGFVVQVLGGRVDQVVIAVLLDSAALGLYAAAMTLILGLLQLAASVSQASFPRVLALIDRAARVQAVRRTLALVLGGILAAAVALAVLADLVVRLLFGPDFLPAADLVRLLLVGIVPHASRDVLAMALKSEGRPLAAGQAETLSLIFFVLALALLVPRHGAAGAAAAYAATQWVVALAMAWHARGLLMARGG
jgi:O-antigen/teichoic acid export membrane protein